MSDPEFVFDGKDKLWQLDTSGKYYCKGPGNIPRSCCNLTELAVKHGPIHHIVRGFEVEIPEVIPEGSGIYFNVKDVAGVVWGAVKSYDPDSATYDIIVKIGQEKIKEVPL